MSPEVGFALFVACLWGPTGLWLVYRTVRGHRARLHGPSDDAFVRTQSPDLELDEINALVGSGEFWICATCSSLNRRRVSRCYSCRARRGSGGGQAPSAVPVGPGIPVMAEGLARPLAAVPVGPGVPFMAGGLARPPVAVPVGPGVPVMAEGLATVALATAATDITAGASAGALAAPEAEAPASVTICPLLGFKDDPSTRYDFPDPRNLCHATSQQGAASGAARRRFGTGTPRAGTSEPISVDHQESHCLTAAHGQCPRYPAVGAVTAIR